jgi:hypothetical protein
METTLTITEAIQRVAELERENALLGGALANVSGALCDASDVVVPDNEMHYGHAVRELTEQRNALRAENARLRQWIGEDGRLLGQGVDEILRRIGENGRLRKALEDAEEALLQIAHGGASLEIRRTLDHINHVSRAAYTAVRAALKPEVKP